jgi:hypothetical protein
MALSLEVFGARFEPDWSVNPTWTPLNPEAREHPVTRGILSFELEDEWYFHFRFASDADAPTPVLLAVPPPETVTDYDGPRCGNPAVRAALATGEAQCLAWIREPTDEGHGRVFAFSGGHFHYNWSRRSFRTLVLNGIVWACGGSVPESGVRSVSREILRYPALMAAVSAGDADDVERHLRRGADPTESNAAGWTPLHFAVARGYAEVAATLIRHGAALDARTSRGRTPLHTAARTGHAGCVAALLAAGADVSARDDKGETPLDLAGDERVRQRLAYADEGE